MKYLCCGSKKPKQTYIEVAVESRPIVSGLKVPMLCVCTPDEMETWDVEFTCNFIDGILDSSNIGDLEVGSFARKEREMFGITFSPEHMKIMSELKYEREARGYYILSEFLNEDKSFIQYKREAFSGFVRQKKCERDNKTHAERHLERSKAERDLTR